MIQIKNLHKTYNKGKDTEFHALKGISFSIDDGELCAVVGKSGAGKSTLLHILGAIDNYDEGSYLLNDIEVGALKEKALARFRNEHVGIILQDFALVEGYSVIENVMLPLRFGKAPRREYRSRAMEALKQVDMDELAGKSVNKLSGGQKQRVAIARAIVNNPDIILADEPTGALDTATAAQIVEVFRKLNEAGKTVIIVTHDVQLAEQCGRVLTISDGVLV